MKIVTFILPPNHHHHRTDRKVWSESISLFILCGYVLLNQWLLTLVLVSWIGITRFTLWPHTGIDCITMNFRFNDMPLIHHDSVRFHFEFRFLFDDLSWDFHTHIIDCFREMLWYIIPKYTEYLRHYSTDKQSFENTKEIHFIFIRQFNHNDASDIWESSNPKPTKFSYSNNFGYEILCSIILMAVKW